MLPDESGLYSGGSGELRYDPEAFAKANGTGLLASGMADLSPVASAKAHSVGGERRAVRGTENLLPDAQTLSVFEEAAVRYQVPVNALLAIGHQETRFDASRVGPMTKYGQAVGMMQYIPSTAKALGIDPRDTRQSVFAAAMEMRQRIDRGLSVPDAIAAHFAGDNVAQWGEKTRAYRQEVTAKAKAIAGLYKSLHRERSEMAVEHERLFNQAENFKRQPASKEKPSASVQQQPSSGEKRPSLAEQAGRDFARGVDNLQSLGYGLAAAVGDVAGLDGLNRWGLEGYLRNKKEAEQNPAVIGTYQNVKSFDDAVRYGVEALAENAASMLPALVTGGGGGFVAKKIAEKSVTNLAGKALAAQVAKRSAQGATAAMVPTSVGMSTGGIYGDIYEQTGEKRAGVAFAAGTLSGALDAIPQWMAVKKAFGPVVAEALQGHVLGRLGKTAGMQFLSEGATEVAQTLIEQGAVRYVDGKPYWNEGLFHQVVDGFLKGGVSGGAMGVASQGVAEVRGRGVKPTPSTAEASSADASTAEMVEPSVADSGPKDSDLLRRMGIEVDEPTPNVPVPMSQVQAEAGRVPPVSENPVSGGPEITRVIDIAPDGEASIRFQAGQPISGLLPLQRSAVVVDAEGRVGGLSEVQNAGLDARLAELDLPRALDPSLDTPTGITAGKHPGYTPESLLKALDDVRNEVSQVVVPEVEMRRSGSPKVDIERDDALTAIAKLGGIDVAQVQSEYGNTITDKAKRVNRGSLFGKPVFRREGGLSLDDMAHALSEYGYLGQDEHGKVDIGGLYDILSSDGPVYHPVAQEKLAQSQMAAAARDEMLRPESILSMAQQRLLADGFVEAEGAEVSQSDAVIDSSGRPSVGGDVAVVADDGDVSVPVGSGARTETFADLFARGEIDVPEDDPILLSRSAGRAEDSGLADAAVDAAGPDGEVDSFGVSSDEIEAALASELAAFRSGRSDVKVVDYEDDLPASIQRQLLQGGISGVEGLWDPTRNQVYLIGENIQDVDRAREVLMHEVVGHASMEEMLGKELMDRFVHRVTRMSLAGNRFAAEAAAWVDKTQPDLPPEIRAREIVAVMAERGYRSADDTLMNRVFEAIRQFLRRAGFKADWVTRISDADIYRLLRDADRFAKTPRGEVVAVNPASTLFSVSGAKDKDAGFDLPQPQGKGAKWKRGARRLREVNQDRYIRVKEVQDAVVGQGGTLDDKSNVYQAETLSHGRKLALSEDFQATEVLPLLRDVGRAGVELDDVALLAYALHAPERNAQIAKINRRYPDGGSGMTNADAQQKVDFLRDKYGDKFSELKGFVSRLQGIARGTADYMVQAGLIDSKTAATWQGVYQSYVPLKGFEQIDEDTGRAVQPAAVVDSGKVGNVRGAESKRAMGRGSLAGQIIENVIADRLRAINRAENNRVGKVLLQFVLDNPDANLWVADMFQKGAAGKWGRVIGPNGQVSLRNTLNVATDPEVFTVKVGGREIHIRLKDRQLAEALSGVHDEKQMGWVLDTLSAANRYLAAVFTGYNPTFTIINGIRDTQGAFFQNLATFGFKGAAKGVVYAARALPTAFKMNFAMDRAKQVARGQNGLPTDWEGYYREMRANGGLTGFMDFRTLTQIGEDAARQVGVAAGNKRAQFKQVGLGVLKAIENANAAIESVNRLAAFRIARENGFSPEKAAAIAKDVTVNFNRRGSQRKASAWFLFFNPAIQGTERFVHAMKHPKVASAAVAMAASAALLAAFSAEALGEDEDGRPIWDKIPESDKSRNLIVPTGVSGAYAKVPLPYGWNVFAVLGVGLVDVLRNRDDPARGMDPARAAGWMATSAVDSFNPVGGSRLVGSAGAGGMLDAMLPAVLQPFSQNIRNENGFGNQLSPTPMYGQKVAKSEQYFPSMEGTGWQVFSSWLNEATGGNAAEDGLVSVRPAELKNAVTFFGGGSLRFVTDIMEALSAEENGWQQAPMLRQLSGADNARNDSRLFYEGLDRVESKHQAYQAFREAGNERLMAEIERDFGPYIALGEAVDVYKGRLSELRGLEARARAQNDAKTRENLALIGQEKLRVMRAFNVEFDRAIRAVEGQ